MFAVNEWSTGQTLMFTKDHLPACSLMIMMIFMMVLLVLVVAMMATFSSVHRWSTWQTLMFEKDHLLVLYYESFCFVRSRDVERDFPQKWQKPTKIKTHESLFVEDHQLSSLQTPLHSMYNVHTCQFGIKYTLTLTHCLHFNLQVRIESTERDFSLQESAPWSVPKHSDIGGWNVFCPKIFWHRWNVLGIFTQNLCKDHVLRKGKTFSSIKTLRP